MTIATDLRERGERKGGQDGGREGRKGEGRESGAKTQREREFKEIKLSWLCNTVQVMYHITNHHNYDQFLHGNHMTIT